MLNNFADSILIATLLRRFSDAPPPRHDRVGASTQSHHASDCVSAPATVRRQAS